MFLNGIFLDYQFNNMYTNLIIQKLNNLRDTEEE